MPRFVLLDAPEVDGVPDAYVDRISTAAANTNPAHEQIQETPRLPEPVAIIPTRIPANALDRRKTLCCGRVDFNGTRIDEAAAKASPPPRSVAVQQTTTRPTSGFLRFHDLHW